MNRRTLALVFLSGFLGSCAAKNYTYYLVEPQPETNPALRDEGTLVRPFGFGSTTVMKVRWKNRAGFWNCCPPTANVIGEVLIVAFSGTRHNVFPSRSSTATK